jgi:hypothetical protein
MIRKISPCAWLICICGCIPLGAAQYRVNNHLELVGDFLYMRRAEIQNKTLVKDADKKQRLCPGECPNHTVMNTRNLVNDFEFEPGYRVGMMFSINRANGFEMNYLYLQPWHGKKKVRGDEDLSFPFRHADYTTDFHDASAAIAKYKSHFWDAEINYCRFMSPRGVDCFSVTGLAGFRYFHLNESFKLKMFHPPDQSSYKVRTKNRIYGAQVGLDFQWNPTRWLSWDFFAKVGGMADDSEQSTFLGDEDNTVILHDFRKHSWEAGIFTDVAAEFAIHFCRFISLHAGYQCMFFSGLTLAPSQVSQKTHRHSGDRVYDHGTAVIHGMFAGIIFAF